MFTELFLLRSKRDEIQYILEFEESKAENYGGFRITEGSRGTATSTTSRIADGLDKRIELEERLKKLNKQIKEKGAEIFNYFLEQFESKAVTCKVPSDYFLMLRILTEFLKDKEPQEIARLIKIEVGEVIDFLRSIDYVVRRR